MPRLLACGWAVLESRVLTGSRLTPRQDSEPVHGLSLRAQFSSGPDSDTWFLALAEVSIGQERLDFYLLLFCLLFLTQGVTL